MILLVALSVLSVLAVVGSIVAVIRDGYRPVPTDHTRAAVIDARPTRSPQSRPEPAPAAGGVPRADARRPAQVVRPVSSIARS